MSKRCPGSPASVSTLPGVRITVLSTVCIYLSLRVQGVNVCMLVTPPKCLSHLLLFWLSLRLFIRDVMHETSSCFCQYEWINSLGHLLIFFNPVALEWL